MQDKDVVVPPLEQVRCDRTRRVPQGQGIGALRHRQDNRMAEGPAASRDHLRLKAPILREFGDGSPRADDAAILVLKIERGVATDVVEMSLQMTCVMRPTRHLDHNLRSPPNEPLKPASRLGRSRPKPA